MQCKPVNQSTIAFFFVMACTQPYFIVSSLPTLTGDRVAVDPHITCRVCEFCKAGRYNMCPKVYFLATPPDDGALARYFVHAADFTFK